jgi:hypothetical protein
MVREATSGLIGNGDLLKTQQDSAAATDSIADADHDAHRDTDADSDTDKKPRPAAAGIKNDELRESR